MNKLLFASLFSALFAISCNKSDDTITPVTEKYMTLTAGSTWNYELINNTLPTTTTPYTLTALNRDSSIFGRSYRVFSNSIGPNEYYNITGDYDYYTFRAITNVLAAGQRVDLYLITGQAVGFTWSQNYGYSMGGFPQTLTLTNTIIDKGISKSVNGNNYSNVIHIKTILTTTGLSAGAFTNDIHSYYAPNVGLIENTTLVTLTLPGTPGGPPTVLTENTTTRLKTATLL